MGLVDLKYFYFLMYYVYLSGLLSEVLGQKGHPQPQFLKFKIKYITAHQKSARKSQCQV
jgi:hypothetical protein